MLMKDVRNSSRCIWDSEEEAEKLWTRIKEFVPDEWRGKKVIGLNERWVFIINTMLYRRPPPPKISHINNKNSHICN